MFSPLFSQSSIHSQLEQKIMRLQAEIVERLTAVGDAFKKFSSGNKGYQNYTGNLESSIGYVILKDGRIIVQNFEAASSGTDRQSGVRKAEAMAQELKADYPSGYILLGFAAEGYALLVESQGKDVVTGAYTKAASDLKKAIASIKKKL